MTFFRKLVLSAKAFSLHLSQPHFRAGSLPRLKLGLALGGGFARGLAHVGVLKVLEEEGIAIDYMAGTSVGSVIAAAFCSGVSAKELAEIAGLVRFRDFARWTLSRYGICNNDRMGEFLPRILKAEDLRGAEDSLGRDGDRFPDRRAGGLSQRPYLRSGARQLLLPGNVRAG